MKTNAKIEDFSGKFEMVNPNNGYKWTDNVHLEILDWGYECYVAYTFNDYSENTAKQLMKALEKYGVLTYITGVTGRTMNSIMQSEMTRMITELSDGKVKVSRGELSGTRFMLN